MGKFYEGCAKSLELWARQFAWLNAAPQYEHTGPGKPPDPVSRMESMKKRDEPATMPDVPAPYIIDWFLEIGPVVAGGMGAAPISWQDLDAWCRLSGIEIDPWEARTLCRLSKAYLSTDYAAKKPDCPAPYGAIEKTQSAAVDSQFKAMMRAFAKPKTAR